MVVTAGAEPKPKPGSYRSIRVFLESTGAQPLGPFSSTFPVAIAGRRAGAEQLGFAATQGVV